MPAIFPFDPAISATDGPTESKPVRQVEVRNQAAVKAEERDSLIVARSGRPQLEGGKQAALDLDAEAAERQEQAGDGQAVPFEDLGFRCELPIALIEFLIQGEPRGDESVAGELIGQGDGMTSEFTDGFSDMQFPFADPQL
jgi:hypothetical protein